MTEIPTDEARILAIDLDGTVCTINSDYSQCEPLPGSIEALRTLRARGFRVYLHTGRHINSAPVTHAWLDRFEVPHDMVVFASLPPAYISMIGGCASRLGPTCSKHCRVHHDSRCCGCEA